MAISEISVDELDERLAEGARLVDVRLPHEFEESHVAGAVLVPLPTVPDNVEAFRGDGAHLRDLQDRVPQPAGL